MHEADVENEWLIPLGNGGYLAGTVSLGNARTYHGLLVGAFCHPVGRCVLLNRVAAEFVDELGSRFALAGGSARFCGVDDCAMWEFDVGEASLRLVIEPFGGGNGVSLQWTVLNDARGRIELRPYLSGRCHHGGDSLSPLGWTTSAQQAVWDPEDAEFSVYLATTGELTLAERVSLDVDLPRETRRGLRDRETIHSTLKVSASVSKASPLRLLVTDAPISLETIEPSSDSRPKQAMDQDLLRRAIMACVIHRPNDNALGVLAGYHWFGEWGRDTMIALPGIGAASGNQKLVADVLRQWSVRLSMGMMPNRLAVDGAKASHNSADASLWYARAVAFWAKAAGDQEELRSDFLPALCEIYRSYTRGTRYGIRVDRRDGMLTAGMDGVQLTWMDARVGETVVTPRRGKCVELNALFYSLVLFLKEALATDESQTDLLQELARQARQMEQNFERVFWNEDEGALADCVHGTAPSFELRPNQLLALGASPRLMPRDKALRALERVERDLLTPFGLRTLHSSHPDYRGMCCGTTEQRDGAYHQGTVWPWLLGPLADAQLALRSEVGIDFQPLMRSLHQGAIGHLSEIFDGDSPHAARGAVAQAWSAAEVFRAMTL